MGTVADRAGRTAPALAVVVTLLSVWIILVRPVLPSDLHLAGGLIVAGGTVAIGLWAGLAVTAFGLLGAFKAMLTLPVLTVETERGAAR